MASETLVLSVRGMECDACVAHVARALREVPGVAYAQVSLSSEQAEVGYDPAQASLTDLRRAVEEEGYGAAALAAR